MEEDQPVKFIRRMFSHAARDRVAVLAVPRSAGRGEQRVYTLPQATSRKVQAWLRHLNARGYDIYLCVNPVRYGSWGRQKADIDEVRRLQLDLDERGPEGPCRGPQGRGARDSPASRPHPAQLQGPLPSPLGYGSRRVGHRSGRIGDAGARGPLWRRPRGYRRGAGDEDAGIQKQETRQGRGPGHLDLVRGSDGQAGGLPETCQCPSRRTGARAPLGGRSNASRTPLPKRKGLGRRRRRATQRRGSRD